MPILSPLHYLFYQAIYLEYFTQTPALKAVQFAMDGHMNFPGLCSTEEDAQVVASKDLKILLVLLITLDIHTILFLKYSTCFTYAGLYIQQ